MLRPLRATPVVALALALMLLSGCVPIPPNATVHGKTYAEWGFSWWQWALAIPYSENPIFDMTGANQDQNQSGPVYFLAGTAGGPSVTRTVTIPLGKKIFFPIVNVIVDYPCPPRFGFEPPPGQSLSDFLTEVAHAIMDYPGVLDVEVDGHHIPNLTNYRATSSMMNFTGDVSMQAFDPCITGTSQPAVSDGYWMMLGPLTPGQHTIHIHGATVPPSLLVLETDVTYLVTVQ
jgi:hypothetical protein